ncbi:hypothetical protein LTR10_021086 [Elasticomyces elasticus]|uniref:Uncharacterized protein n=1 Tax=Exophiala sideris TaxID=1016849 RepID=A0ABR0J756_9EURO|nr:hypothetical protein LTR10_021086 [Elasticomyces elasticus]KAK5028884.1 hypothetical protein LTS07_006264 [Exophiala sideris]KAK5035753.1 hypothetical protein LTR13_005883 [Exophiala sideris]KAK5057388.1 hypothetical protein LTR69_007428 [Exophiala sideris]
MDTNAYQAPSISRFPPNESRSTLGADDGPPMGKRTAPPPTITLEWLPSDFSFSRYLSHNALTVSSPPFLITNDGRPLPDSHIILLALNEECRILCRGAFYHLPLRSDVTKGHPCDIVFVDEVWGDKGNAVWDSSDWKERLDMCDATRKIRHSETVIAICTRILKVDLPAPFKGHEMSHPYANTSDPAVSKHTNIIAYSRPLEDQSRVILVYPNHHSAPFLWPVDIAESTPCCTSFPTPNDLSETHLLHWQVGGPVFGRESVLNADTKKWDQVTQYLQGPVPGNRDVVVCLLHIWNTCRGCVDTRSSIAQKQTCTENWGGVFEDVKDRWSDLEKRIEGQDLDTREAMLKFWPTE